MAEFLIDTDVIIDIFLGESDASAWLNEQSDVELAISVVGVMEVLQGARNKNEQIRFRTSLAQYETFGITENDSSLAIEIFESHHLTDGIGILDSFLSAQAMNRKIPILTFNTKHFRGIKGLIVAKPYQRKN